MNDPFKEFLEKEEAMKTEFRRDLKYEYYCYLDAIKPNLLNETTQTYVQWLEDKYFFLDQNFKEVNEQRIRLILEIFKKEEGEK